MVSVSAFSLLLYMEYWCRERVFAKLTSFWGLDM